MIESLIGALKTLTSLQRWNFLPRVDFWVEAENVAYVTHVGYAIGRTHGMSPENLRNFLIRSLLKSFNKHFLSDIPVPTREAFKDIRSDVWKELVNKTAAKTSNLFPRAIAEEVNGYLTHGGDYMGKDKKVEKEQIEILLKYAQNKVAIEECKTNQKVYVDEYAVIIENINKKIKKLKNYSEFDKIFSEDKTKAYLSSVKRLKYLRRWNKINRNIESSVLSHTFMVAFLAFLFSRMCEQEIVDHKLSKDDFVYKAILRALFHDIPETLTGDIPTPAKKLIEEVDKKSLDDVEKDLVEKSIMTNAPKGVVDDIRGNNLLAQFDTKKYSVDSLVKECDKLAIVMECLFEKSNGIMAEEMISAYHSYLNNLLNSEWSYIREFCTRVLLEFPFRSIHRD
jgi:putative hydrolase of HD superfamily